MCDYNFYEFIDSPDIREYLKQINLSIAKQAVLIAKSECKSIENKIGALQYLLDTHDDEEFETDDIYSNYGENGEFKPKIVDVIKGTIIKWKILLEKIHDDGRIFITRSTDVGTYLHDHNFTYNLYSSYEKAFNILFDEKKEFYDNNNDIKMYGEIISVLVDDLKYNNITCRFNSELIMYNIYGNLPESEYSLLDEWNTFIPLPFKSGDILKSVELHAIKYYVFPNDKWEEVEDPKKREVFTDFSITLDTGEIDRSKNNVEIYWDRCNALSLQYCSKDELPDKYNILKYISDVRLGKCDMISLLNDITTDYYRAIYISDNYCTGKGFKK